MKQHRGVGATVGTFLVLVWAIGAVFYFLIINCGRVGGGRGVFIEVQDTGKPADATGYR